MTQDAEGVIKYRLVFDQASLQISVDELNDLNINRAKLKSAALLGEDASRYGGLGFGNISCRVMDKSDCFYISATQTGHLPELSVNDIACVTEADSAQNILFAKGSMPPSSEAMTHSVLYELHQDINAVVHVHSPDIWRSYNLLGLPSVESHIPYGTPEMALAVDALGNKLYRPGETLCFVMLGHEDGVVAAGSSLAECADVLLSLQSRAKRILA